MALNLYKPGQGYWTRLMSAIGAGVLALAGASWLWNKLSVIQSDYRLYIQAGVAVGILLILGALLYWVLGTKPRTCDFLIATEGEMKKVNWPTRREVIGSTWVVIWCVVLMALLLFGVDVLFSTIFKYINILQ